MNTEPKAKIIEYINFHLGNSIFAINVDHTIDIIELMKLNKIPVKLMEIAGIFLKDDQVTVAIDLAQYYGQKSFDNSDKMVIVVKWQGQQYGLVIDSIINIGDINSESRLINLEDIFHKVEQGMAIDSLRD